ncbi:MAG: TlpA disulfide reductase family protein [Ferruginibacter sp.]
MKLFLIALCTHLFCLPAFAQDVPSIKAKALAQLYNQPNDSIYVINFWATFCKPCIEEMPYLQSIAAKYASQKVQLLLVSVDQKSVYPTQLKTFVNTHQISAPVLWLNETNADYFCPIIDEKWSGSIPATLFIKPSTGKRIFVEAELTEKEFETTLNKMIQ